MEKYFIATNSNLGEDYLKYRANVKQVNQLVVKFTSEQGIKAKEYYVNNSSLYIVPVDTDIDKFDKVLKKPLENGLREFKANSKIIKAWKEKLNSEELKVYRKIDVGDYFGLHMGGFRSRLFEIDGIVYCSIEPKDSHYGKFEISKEMTEIKASEFFKVIEDYETKHKAK